MNLFYLKKEVMKYYNQVHQFRYYGGRGQDDYFEGKIIRFYSRNFVILTSEGKIKNFSYNDFLIKTLKIV